MEDALDLRNELLENYIDYVYGALEFSSDGIFITDSEGNTLYVNPAYEEISGLKRSEIIGVNLKTLLEKKYLMNLFH